MICTICFEDLKPNVEDLQSISICGHVFHELWSVILLFIILITHINVMYISIFYRQTDVIFHIFQFEIAVTLSIWMFLD